jgi:hypothetical protein
MVFVNDSLDYYRYNFDVKRENIHKHTADVLGNTDTLQIRINAGSVRTLGVKQGIPPKSFAQAGGIPSPDKAHPESIKQGEPPK